MNKTKMLQCMMFLIVLVFTINFSSATDYTYNINMSSLPNSFTQELSFQSQQNQTIEINYGKYISGPNSINLKSREEITIDATISIPPLNETTQISNITLSNSTTIEYEFNIINDPTEDDFWVTSDKDEYFVNETAFITLYGTKGTLIDINITGCNESQSYKTTIDSSTAFVIVPKCEDNYLVTADFSKLGTKIRKQKEIIAKEKFSCNIDSIPRLTFNQSVTLNSDIKGGKSSYYYRWTFPNGSTSNNAQPKHSFTNIGLQTIKLKVKDSRNEETYCDLAINVKEESYDLKINIRDSETNNRIGDAEVEIEDIIRKTNKNGFVLFKDLEEDKYRIEVKRNGYEKYSKRHTIDDDTELTINLTKINKELSLPNIRVKNVVQEQIIIARDLDVTFEVSSAKPVDNCKMLISQESLLGYTITDNINNVSRNKDLTLKAKIDNGNHLIKIACENQDGIAYSTEYKLIGRGFENKKETVSNINKNSNNEDSSKETASSDETIKPFKETLDALKKSQKTLSNGNEIAKDISNMLSFESNIKSSISTIMSLIEQAEAIEGLNIADENKRSQRAKLLKQLQEIKAKTPKGITLKSKERVIEQVSEEKTEKAIEEFITSRGRTVTKKEKSNMLQASREIQESIITYSDVGLIEIEYLNGKKELLSTIRKSYTISGNLSSIEIIETIPKSVANSATEINFNRPYEIIKEDPIVKIRINKDEKLLYFVEGEISTDSLKSVKSIAFVEAPNTQRNMITGLSIFNGGISFAKSGLFLIIFTVLALIGTSFITKGAMIKEYAGKTTDSIISNIPKPKTNNTKKESSQAIVLLTTAIEHIKNKNDNEAIKLYPNILKNYSKLDNNSKNEVKPIVSYLSQLVDIQYMSRLLDEAMTQIIESRIDTKSDMCQNIESAYSNLSESTASKIETKYSRYQRMLHLYTTRQSNKLKLMLERENGTYKESEINDVLFRR